MYYVLVVGEVNVVEKMKVVDVVIGGEGNGGIIDFQLYYGCDVLVGIVLVFIYLVKSGKSINEFCESYFFYFMVKDKIQFCFDLDVEVVLVKVQLVYGICEDVEINIIDGVKFDFL